MLQIVLPLSLASLFVVVVCIKYGPIRNSKRGKVYSEVISLNLYFYFLISEVHENMWLILYDSFFPSRIRHRSPLFATGLRFPEQMLHYKRSWGKVPSEKCTKGWCAWADKSGHAQ